MALDGAWTEMRNSVPGSEDGEASLPEAPLFGEEPAQESLDVTTAGFRLELKKAMAVRPGDNKSELALDRLLQP